MPIALALLRAGRRHLGHELTVFDDGDPIGRAKVTTFPFYEPCSERMHG